MGKTSRKNNRANDSDVSRRKFIARAVAGAGATSIIAFGESESEAAAQVGAKAIKTPDEFVQAAKAAPVKAAFPMTGAQVFARVCKEEGLAALFSCPGNYSVVNAIALEGIPTYSVVMKGRCVMPRTPSFESQARSRRPQVPRVRDLQI